MLPEYPEIVTELLAIAQEELDHFRFMRSSKRGYTFGRRKDDYVNELANLSSREARKI
jgi:tRNA-(ms[2]io[6]A)-hydroxylase